MAPLLNTDRPRVLHLLNSRHFNGAENVAAGIMAGLAEGWQSVFVSREGPVEDHLAARDLPFLGVSKLRPKELRRIVARFDPHLIHAHDYRASLAATTLGRPVVSHLHNNYPWARKLGPVTLAYRLAVPRFRRIIAVSDSVVGEHFFRKAIEPKSEVVGNGLDFDQIGKKAFGKMATHDVAFVGRLTEQKDPLAFMRILRSLQSQDRAVTGIMVGDGDLMGDCREARSAYGLEETLEIRGYLSNPYPILASSRVCLVTSQWEGFGLVALEAMSLGAAVLGRRGVGGLSGILEAVSPELLCDSEDEFIEKSRDLLNDEQKRSELARLGKRYVEGEFSQRRFLDRIERIYREALA